MSQASNYCEKTLINALFGKTSDWGPLTNRPTMYVALATAAINDTHDGSSFTEATYGSYARQSTGTSDWNAATEPDGKVDNANVITFPECTSGSETVTHFALCTAASGGEIVAYGTLVNPLAVSTGVTVKFNATKLSVSMA